MQIRTHVLAHKVMRRGLKQAIRDLQRHMRLKKIAGMAAVYSPARSKVKGMKKKFIYRKRGVAV